MWGHGNRCDGYKSPVGQEIISWHVSLFVSVLHFVWCMRAFGCRNTLSKWLSYFYLRVCAAVEYVIEVQVAFTHAFPPRLYLTLRLFDASGRIRDALNFPSTSSTAFQ
jgi:hypothetical protein